MTIKTFDDMNGMLGGMDSSFDDLRRRLTSPWWNDSDSGRQLIDTEDGYTLVVDVPGFERDEIEITVEDGMLTILATQEMDDDDVTDESSLRTTRRSRRTHERMRLPESVLVDEITASYRNGVLEILLPTESAQDVSGVQIQVQG